MTTEQSFTAEGMIDTTKRFILAKERIEEMRRNVWHTADDAGQVQCASEAEAHALLDMALASLLASDYERGKADGLREAALEVPYNWLDPLLSGDAKVITLPANGRHIENLLRSVKERILARLPKGDSNG